MELDKGAELWGEGTGREGVDGAGVSNSVFGKIVAYLNLSQVVSCSAYLIGRLSKVKRKDTVHPCH